MKMSLIYRKKITPMDVWEKLKHKGIKPSDVTIEEDDEEVRIMIAEVELTEEEEKIIDDMMKGYKRKE